MSEVILRSYEDTTHDGDGRDGRVYKSAATPPPPRLSPPSYKTHQTSIQVLPGAAAAAAMLIY